MSIVRAFLNLFQFNRTNWKAMFLSFLVASVFWIFNAFNKIYSAELQFPLHFVYNEKEYVPKASLAHQLKLNVSGTGWELFRNSFGFFSPLLRIELEHPAEVKKIVASTLIPSLASQVGSLHINYVVADTLYIMLDHRLTRSFHVKVDESTLSFRKGFGKTGSFNISPDKVELNGPSSVLRNLPDTILISIPKKDIHKDFNDDVEVPFFKSEFVNRNPPLVNVKIKVVPVKEINFRLGVMLVNKTTSRLLKDSVDVRCEIPVERANDFKERIQHMKALVDLEGGERSTKKVLPQIVGLPDYARVLSVDSLKSGF